ncbi:cytochrome P450 [Xylaria cf. heliscus]|nr:cytochrome P450 [Xylaria cf. heliscus]
MAAIPLLLIAVLLLYVLHLCSELRARSKIPPGTQPLPGPKCYPILGRVHDVPAETSWLKFYEWSKEYGPIYQTKMFGTVHVWISSEEVAHELLSRRSSIYSDRPQIPNLPDNRTKGDYLALTGFNDTWRRQRKLAQQLMAANVSLHDYARKERDRFLYLLSINPRNYSEYIEQFTSRTVARLSWGTPHSAEVLRVTTAGLLETISPSGALPNILWWLMYLPTWLSPWQQKENARHALEAKVLNDNVRHAHERIKDGTAMPSFIRTFILNHTTLLDGAIPEAEASYVVGQMAIAGALTIGSPIQSFLLAMLHYPKWQKRLQDEVDETCAGACPQWEDRDKLPLLRAVVKEVIRWRPPVPTGIPHALEQDDIYNGYFIPAGATIHALEWSMTRDEDKYPDADTFNPARWLDPSYPTYREPLTTYPRLQGHSQFGFGRRTCQGLPLVDQDLFLSMGGMAWAFDIRRKRVHGGGLGDEVPVHWNDYTPLLIAKPRPFEFDVVVRGGEERKRALRRMWELAKDEDDKAEIEVDLRRRREDSDALRRAAAANEKRRRCWSGANVENVYRDFGAPGNGNTGRVTKRAIVVDDASDPGGSDTSGPSGGSSSPSPSSSSSDSDG